MLSEASAGRLSPCLTSSQLPEKKIKPSLRGGWRRLSPSGQAGVGENDSTLFRRSSLVAERRR